MKRTVNTALGLTLLTTVLASCNNQTPAPAPVIGTWVGKWAHGSNVPNVNYSMIIRADGTMSVYSSVLIGDTSQPQNVGAGTWTYTGDTLKTQYRYTGSSTDVYTASTLVNGNRLEGKWGLKDPPTDGSFYLDRK